MSGSGSIPGGRAPVRLGAPRPRTVVLVGAVALIATLVASAGSAVGLAGHGSVPVSTSVPGPSAPSVVPAHRLATVPLSSGSVPTTPLTATPAWLAYDPADQSLYIAVPPSSVDIAPGNVVAPGSPQVNVTVPVGQDPFGVAYDAATGDVFVTNDASSNVSVLFGNLTAPIASIPVGSGPTGVAYDPANGYVYVANNGSNNVSVINGTTLDVVGSVAVGNGPMGVAVNATSGNVFVADSGSDAVTTISGTSDTVVATVGVGSAPYGVAVDNATGDVYVTNSNSGNLSVLPPSGTGVIATITTVGGGALEGVTYDWDDGYVWAADGETVLMISPANESVAAVVQFDPSGMAFDSTNGNVCGTNTANRTLECLVADDATGGDEGLVTFTENGLPAATDWTVAIAGGVPQLVRSNESEFSVYVLWYSYEGLPASWYEALPTGSYFASPFTVTAESDGNPVALSVNYTTQPGLYPVSLEESGLPLYGPADPGWTASVGSTQQSSNQSAMVFAEPTGTYDFTVPPYSSPYFGTYDPSPCNGTIVVGTTGVTQSIAFSSGSATCDQVEFLAAGLPDGAAWNVTLAGLREFATAPTDTLNFTEPTGSYSYAVGAPPGYRVTPASGTVEVGTAPVQVDLAFASTTPTYLVTFAETGLPTGANWSVRAAGSTYSSEFTTIRFDQANGTYPYAVNDVAGEFYPSPQSGTFSVAGAPLTISISYTAAAGLYPVTFDESGLPPDTLWGVEVNGSSTTSATAAINFTEPNGTYEYEVGPVAGYLASSPNGSVVVAGLAIAVPVDFAPASTSVYGVEFSETGLAAGTAWGVSVAGGAPVLANTSAFTLSEPNGSYSYTVVPVAGYNATPSEGSFVVAGAFQSVDVEFAVTNVSPARYAVVIEESGLPANTTWTATARATASGVLVTNSTNGTLVELELTNGTWSLSVETAAGVPGSLTLSNLTVRGTVPTAVVATFAPTTTGPPPPNDETPIVILETLGIGMGLGAATLAVVLLVRRRQKRPPVPPEWTP